MLMGYMSQLKGRKILYRHRLEIKLFKKEKMTSDAENLENASQKNLGKPGITILALLEEKKNKGHQSVYPSGLLSYPGTAQCFLYCKPSGQHFGIYGVDATIWLNVAQNGPIPTSLNSVLTGPCDCSLFFSCLNRLHFASCLVYVMVCFSS